MSKARNIADIGSHDVIETDSDGVTITGDLTIPDKIVHTGDTNTAIRFPAADTVTVETAGSERLRVDSDGDVLCGSDGGGDIGSSTKRFKDLYLSGGVYLGGATSANLLDDYEEGTWTPAAGANSGLTGTFSTYSGSYVKVGKLVFVKFGISGTSMLWSSTAAYLTLINLPFASSGTSHGGFTNTSGTFGTVNGDVFSNGSTLILTAEWGSGSSDGIIGSCVYEAT